MKDEQPYCWTLVTVFAIALSWSEKAFTAAHSVRLSRDQSSMSSPLDEIEWRPHLRSSASLELFLLQCCYFKEGAVTVPISLTWLSLHYFKFKHLVLLFKNELPAMFLNLYMLFPVFAHFLDRYESMRFKQSLCEFEILLLYLLRLSLPTHYVERLWPESCLAVAHWDRVIDRRERLNSKLW